MNILLKTMSLGMMFVGIMAVSGVASARDNNNDRDKQYNKHSSYDRSDSCNSRCEKDRHENNKRRDDRKNDCERNDNKNWNDLWRGDREDYKRWNDYWKVDRSCDKNHRRYNNHDWEYKNNRWVICDYVR